MGKRSFKKGHLHRWGHHWGHLWGPHSSGHRYASDSSSESSSDSESGKRKKCKKSLKKQMKYYRKFGSLGQTMQESDKTANKTKCTLCCHLIQPLVDTEILECGHIYHRLCLKGLFELSNNSSEGQLQVMCTQCKHQINENLINEFKARFEGQQNPGPQVMELNN